MQIRSLYFHNPSVKGFETIIKFLVRKKYNFLSIEDLCGKLKDQNFLGKNVFITFDDGWKSNLNLIPIIEKYNIPITIFVSVEPVISGNFWWEFVTKERGYEKMFQFKNLSYQDFYNQLNEIKKKIGPLDRSAMTLEDLKNISKHPLISIQSHTINHPILTNVPDEVLDMELRDSKSKLEDITGKSVFAFSYPNGSLSDREVNATKKYYDIAFTTEQNNIKINNNPYLLPRYALTGDYYKDILKMYGIWKYIRRILKK